MDFFNVMSSLYTMLSKVVYDTQIISLVDVSKNKIIASTRMDESKYVITENVKKSVSSTVTAHVLSEYRPTQLKLDRMMRDSNVLIIDRLLEDIGGVRGVFIQSC